MKLAYLIEPPFNYLDQAGRVTGCDIGLARHVLHQLGVGEIEFVETEFAQLLPGLADGRWHMTTGLFVTDERRRHALFSAPIWALPDGLLIRAEDAAHHDGYQSLARSGTRTLAVLDSQFQHKTALELGVPATRIHVFDTYEQAARAVRDGRVDAYASVARAHEGYVRQNSGLGLAVVNVPAREKPPALGCFAFPLAATEFKERVDRVLSRFIGGADHRQLVASFGFDAHDANRLLKAYP